MMAEALAGKYEEVALVEALARSYAIPVAGVLDEETKHLKQLRNKLSDSADAWSAALGELTQANLDSFLAERPQWQAMLAPRVLDTLPMRKLELLQNTIVGELRAFAGAAPERMGRLEHGHVRTLAARAAAFRS